MDLIPSQVVSLIDGLFGPSRNPLDRLVIQFSHRDQVRTLLRLIGEIPTQLITVPFREYSDYLQAQASLISALTTWDTQGQGPPAAQVQGRDPIGMLRDTLAMCPDELPSPHPPFKFVSDPVSQANISQDIRAAWIDFGGREWKGATVFAATAVEALLFWALKVHPNGPASGKLENLHLRDCIREAGKLQIISAETLAQANLANDARRLIHAGREAVTGLTCNKATALTALAALEAVIADTTRHELTVTSDL